MSENSECNNGCGNTEKKLGQCTCFNGVNPFEYALIAKPKWRRFFPEVPEKDRYIIIPELSMHEAFFSQGMLTYQIRGKSMVIPLSSQPIRKWHWCYSEDLDLTTLLP